MDGILKRPSTDPKIFHTDTSTEYWQRRSSLTDTDEEGKVDLVQPTTSANMCSREPARSAKGAIPNYGAGNRKCEQLSNPTHLGFLARALLVALEDWIRRGIEPPPSRAPSLRLGTLVLSDQATIASRIFRASRTTACSTHLASETSARVCPGIPASSTKCAREFSARIGCCFPESMPSVTILRYPPSIR